MFVLTLPLAIFLSLKVIIYFLQIALLKLYSNHDSSNKIVKEYERAVILRLGRILVIIFIKKLTYKSE